MPKSACYSWVIWYLYFSFLRNFHIDFRCGYTIVCLTPGGKKDSDFLTSLPALITCFLSGGHLNEMKRIYKCFNSFQFKFSDSQRCLIYFKTFIGSLYLFRNCSVLQLTFKLSCFNDIQFLSSYMFQVVNAARNVPGKDFKITPHLGSCFSDKISFFRFTAAF